MRYSSWRNWQPPSSGQTVISGQFNNYKVDYRGTEIFFLSSRRILLIFPRTLLCLSMEYPRFKQPRSRPSRPTSTLQPTPPLLVRACPEAPNPLSPVQRLNVFPHSLSTSCFTRWFGFVFLKANLHVAVRFFVSLKYVLRWLRYYLPFLKAIL